jgi:signal transduction histidine kinase
VVHLLEISSEGRPFALGEDTGVSQVPPGTGRLHIRYTSIHLGAPERVQYSYKLDGLDTDWVQAGNRREVDYNSLRQGSYRFRVRAGLSGAQPSEVSYAFDLLPHFYETSWFQALGAMAFAGLIWTGYKLREQQVRSRYAAVLEERARIAREVHDTLAQAFVGISSQLEVVEMHMAKEPCPARESLDLARRMAQHSLTEARRSVMDLRAEALESHDLAFALDSGVRAWTAGSGVDAEVDVQGETGDLPEDVSHHVLRIAQEAVANVLKHAHADRINLTLRKEPKKLTLNVRDNGCGFEPMELFALEMVTSESWECANARSGWVVNCGWKARLERGHCWTSW